MSLLGWSKFVDCFHNFRIQLCSMTRIRRKEIHVRHFSWDVDDEVFGVCQALLTEKEKARASRFRFEKDRRQFIVSRGALRVILSGYGEVDPVKIRLGAGEFGKPFLENRTEIPIQFNVAHSGGFVLISVCLGSDLGVDLEKFDPGDKRMFGLIETICSPGEAAFVKSLPPDQIETCLTRLWTAKEAVLKAAGKGLQIEPLKLDIPKPVLKGGSETQRVTCPGNGEFQLIPFPRWEKETECSAALAIADVDTDFTITEKGSPFEV